MSEKKTITIQVRQVNRDFAKQDISAYDTKGIPLTEGMSLYHALQTAVAEGVFGKEEVALSAPCAGNGTCGGCKVLVANGKLPVTEKDKLIFSIEKAIGIGLLPASFKGKIKAVGNTSLKGTKEYLRGMISPETLREVKDFCEEIYLAGEPDFQDYFLRNMNFQTI